MIATRNMWPAVFAALLSFIATAHAWTVTIYYMQDVSIYPEEIYTYNDGDTVTYSADTYSRVIEVKPTVTAFETISAETSINTFSDVTYVNVLVPTGVGELYDYYTDYDSESSSYFVELSYTANTRSCTDDDEKWVWATAVEIYVPSGATPVPMKTSYSETQDQPFAPTSTYTHLIVNPTDVGSSSMSSLSSYYSSYWMDYSCSVPSEYADGIVVGAVVNDTSSDDIDEPISSSGGSSWGSWRSAPDGRCPDGYSWYYDWGFGGEGNCNGMHRYIRWGLQPWEFVIVIIFGWAGLFIIIGMIESYVNFSKLAKGRKARRGLPLSFCAIMPLLSCFFLCCSKRGFGAKSKEDQELMAAAWKETGFFKKIGRWLKWGFRYKYPAFLGPAPFRRTKWEDKDIAIEAQRRLSVSGGTGPQMVGGVGGVPYIPAGSVAADKGPAGVQVQPVHPGQGYYAPAPPQAAYASPGVENRDFALQQQQQQPGAPQIPPQTPPRPLSAVNEEQRPASASRSLRAQESAASPVSPVTPTAEAVPSSLQPGVPAGAPPVPAGAPPVPTVPAPVAEK